MSSKNKDSRAGLIAKKYIRNHLLDKSDDYVPINTYIVWKCKILQNWKYLISTDLPDGMYYEVTYNGDKEEWYLDAYKKFDNVRIKDVKPYTEERDGVRNS